MALLARYNELNETDRIESVKLPNIYRHSVTKEREDDSYGLLKNF